MYNYNTAVQNKCNCSTHTYAICKAECSIPQRHSISPKLKAEQTGSERTTVQPHSKAEESSVQRVTMRTTATSAEVLQELVVIQLGCSDRILNNLKFSTSKLCVRTLWQDQPGRGGILNLYIKIIMKHFNPTANKTFLKGHSVFPWKSFSVTAFHKKFINWSFFIPLMTRAENSDNFTI